MRKLKNVKLFESFDQEEEIPFFFPRPVTIMGKVYSNTHELEKDYDLGGIMNTEDGLRFMCTNKPEGLTLDELVAFLNQEEEEEEDFNQEEEEDM